MAGGKKPKGEVHEVINALEVLSAQNGQRPDVVQNKRDCFQVPGPGLVLGANAAAVDVPRCVVLECWTVYKQAQLCWAGACGRRHARPAGRPPLPACTCLPCHPLPARRS